MKVQSFFFWRKPSSGMTWCETCLHVCLHVVCLTWSLNATWSLYNLFFNVFHPGRCEEESHQQSLNLFSRGRKEPAVLFSLTDAESGSEALSFFLFLHLRLVSSSPSSAAHAVPLFGLRSDGHAVLIHAPAPSTLPASRRPTLGTNKETNNKDHLPKKYSSPDGPLQTHLLLFKVATPVTVGHVDIIMGLKNLSTEAFGKCSQQFTTRGLQEEADLCGVIHSQSVWHTFTEVHIKYNFTSLGLWVGVRSRIR